MNSFQAIIFDMDGTITRPWFDFKKIRDEIGIEEPVLESLMKMEEGPERQRGFEILHRHEKEGIEASKLNSGVREILSHLISRNIPTGLVTRNSRFSVDGILAKHTLAFDVIVTREDAPVKPSPEPLLRVCEALQIEPKHTLMVGDFKYDVIAGRAAGTRTCLLTNGDPPSFSIESDHVIDCLTQLIHLIA